jgi:hypothetical protein
LDQQSLAAVMDIPSDVKTVTYYVKTPDAGAVAANAIDLTVAVDSLSDPSVHSTGLVRRELDRSVASAALTNGSVVGLESAGELLAPEAVGIEFRYFDGVEWRLEWDTSVEQMLPLAIQILLAMTTTVDNPSAAVNSTTELPGNIRIYNMIVHLPTGGQPKNGSAASGTSTTGTATSGTSTTSGATP